ncbi:MAG: hypothetical protein A2Y40_07750 [Candidatus Margulisbacteria bacterium GWF2_35_9]|nr:MAG: hypothetical protein A2Y40_07750 [Candidatus Margulisbacteria bacterium GWF2_35_9]
MIDYSAVKISLEEIGDFFRVKIQDTSQGLKNNAINTTQETTQETTKKAIIRLLRADSYYTRTQLCNILGKSDATIKQHLEELKRENIIKRIGATKGGHWEVVE